VQKLSEASIPIDPEPPLAGTFCELLFKEMVHATASCVTVYGIPAMSTVPVLDELLALGATVILTVPEPVAVTSEFNVIQLAFFPVFQRQLAPVATLIVDEPPAALTVPLVDPSV
jgi:hypothetical protein